MRLLSNCLVCDSENNKLLYPSTYSGGLQEAHRYFLAERKASAHGDIRCCTSCGFMFTSPQFEEAEYDTIYSRIGTEARNRTVTGGAGAAATERRFRRLRELVAIHTAFDVPFLDFGCGDGDFLRVAGSNSGTGFEIGEPGTRTGLNGGKIFSGRFQNLAGTSDIPWESQSFAVAFDVLEHLPALLREIALLRRVIRPGGYLFVTVPDTGSVMARTARGRWNMLLLEHLWYFSQTTLDALLRRAGFLAIAHSSVPYDASVGHVAKRVGESFGLSGVVLPTRLGNIVVPVPAGVLFGAYRRKD